MLSHVVNFNIKDPQLIQIRNESQKKIKDYFYKRYKMVLYTFKYINSSYDDDINNMLLELYEKISIISSQNLNDLKQFYASKIEELNKKVTEIKKLYQLDYIERDISDTFQKDAKKVIEICEYIYNELENYDDYSESLQRLFD